MYLFKILFDPIPIVEIKLKQKVLLIFIELSGIILKKDILIY